VWDNKGVVLATRSTTHNCIVESMVPEALTACHAVEFSKEMAFMMM
jgi:hypothetical protein